MYRFFFIVYIIHICLYLNPAPVKAQGSWAQHSIKHAERAAEQKRREAKDKENTIDMYYNRGRAAYNGERYAEAIAAFEQLLRIQPEYEAARLYIESSRIMHRIQLKQRYVDSIKLEMANIIAEYEERRAHIKAMTLNYLLELAQKSCQVENYEQADEYHNLCYKLHPEYDDKLEWFINAVFELRELSASLKRCYEEIEKLTIE